MTYQNRQIAERDSEAVGCALERMLNVNRTLKVLNLSGCQVTDLIAKHILAGLIKNTSLMILDMGSSIVTVSCAVSLLQCIATNPTLTITVGILGVGRVEIDKPGTISCVVSDTVLESCVEFFRALHDSSMNVSKLNIRDLTDQAAEFTKKSTLLLCSTVRTS